MARHKTKDMYPKRNILPAAELASLGSGGAFTIGSSLVSRMLDAIPKGKRSRFAKELKKKNPAMVMVDPEVEDMVKEFHGRAPLEEIDIRETDYYDSSMAVLGSLEELGVLGSDLRTKYEIAFKTNRPWLACDGSGKNLEISGGDQHLDIESDTRLVPLGYLISIVYYTDKHHLEDSHGEMVSYEHYFGEEFYKEFVNPEKYKSQGKWFDELLACGAVRKAIAAEKIPILTYDKVNEKLAIVGGKYVVEDVGIKD